MVRVRVRVGDRVRVRVGAGDKVRVTRCTLTKLALSNVGTLTLK